MSSTPTRTWFVYMGEFKLGEINYTHGTLCENYRIKTANHAVPEVSNNVYQTYAGAVNFYRKSVPEETRSFLKFIEQTSKPEQEVV